MFCKNNQNAKGIRPISDRKCTSWGHPVVASITADTNIGNNDTYKVASGGPRKGPGMCMTGSRKTLETDVTGKCP